MFRFEEIVCILFLDFVMSPLGANTHMQKFRQATLNNYNNIQDSVIDWLGQPYDTTADDVEEHRTIWLTKIKSASLQMTKEDLDNITKDLSKFDLAGSSNDRS